MKIAAFISSLLLATVLQGQNYTALNGSSYTGSLSVHQNPASIVNVPFKWDLTLFGFQDKHYTNIIDIVDYSLISNPAKSGYIVRGGEYKRDGILNANLNLLNTRMALNKNSGIAFGVNFRFNGQVNTSRYQYVDTIKRFGEFFSMNESNQGMNARFTSSSWVELYGSYARTVYENEFLRLNAGATVKVNRGIAGLFTRLDNGNFQRIQGSDPAQYLVTSGDLNFGYSSNLDGDGGLGKRIFSTESGASLDLGLELILKPQGIAVLETPAQEFDYDWKIGLSFLDLGYAQYHFSPYSTAVASILPGITDGRLDESLDSTTKRIPNLKDSLSALYQFSGTYEGKYRINHPARMVLNVDRFITDAFFINAEISVDLSNLPIRDNFRVQDMNRITLTPRWETRKKGFYLPIYYNTRNQIWVGGAFRFGPLLFGVHNWANILSKNKMNRGGGYIALTFRAKDITGSRGDKRLDCPW